MMRQQGRAPIRFIDPGSGRLVSSIGLSALLGLALPMRPSCAADPCAPVGPTAEVAAVLDGFELALDDGRVLRLAGIDPARATPDRPGLGTQAGRVLERWLGGRRIVVQALASTPDRWDRVPALVALAAAEPAAGPGPPPDASINAALVGAGWARARPDAALRSCSASFLAVEAGARARGLGLWADPYYAIVRADDAAGLALRSGGMVVVDGRVGLRNRRSGLVVTFGATGSGLVAILSRKPEKSLAKAGVDLQKLGGTEVRIRGVVDDRFGPRIDLLSADQIEPVRRPGEDDGSTPQTGREEPDRNR